MLQLVKVSCWLLSTQMLAGYVPVSWQGFDNTVNTQNITDAACLTVTLQFTNRKFQLSTTPLLKGWCYMQPGWCCITKNVSFTLNPPCRAVQGHWNWHQLIIYLWLPFSESSLADPRDQSGHAPIRSVNGTWPQPATKFAWADGNWAIYSTYHANRIY